MTNKIQLRGDTAANWTSNNTTLAAREVGIETDTRKVKVGDGTTSWTTLSYTVDRTALPMVSGGFYAPPTVTVTAVLTVNQRITVGPMIVPNAITISEIACQVTVAGNSGATVTLVIYDTDPTAGIPRNLLYSTVIAADTTGIKTVTGITGVTLQPGAYWFGGLILAATTAPTMYCAQVSTVNGGINFGHSTNLTAAAGGVMLPTQATPPNPWPVAGTAVAGGNIVRASVKVA